MKPAIKICGITRAEDAILCEELGVEYVGLNMVPSSPRCISPQLAKTLRNSLRNSIPVLIFQDADPEAMLILAREIGCTHIQCHGTEDPQTIGKLPLTIIKAYRFVPDAEVLEQALTHVAYVLVDGTKNGELTDIERAALLPESIRMRMFLAGGLHADNVAAIVRHVLPFAVDSASGIESSLGIKDGKKLRAFLHAVRSGSPTSL